MFKLNLSSIKNINASGSLALGFKLLGLAGLAAWLVWGYTTSMAKVKIEDKAPTKQVMVNVDQNAYKTTEKYLKQVQEFSLPDYGSIYSNPEPFREYK